MSKTHLPVLMSFFVSKKCTEDFLTKSDKKLTISYNRLPKNG